MSLAVQASTSSRRKNASRSKRKSWRLAAPCNDLELTKSQRGLVRETFKRIEPASDLVARLFYLRLFELDPSLQALFKGRKRIQRRELMGALKLAMLSLDHPKELAPVLKLLGTRHRHYGVKNGDYVTFAMAWIWTMEQSLEWRFTPEAREAWMALISGTARTMAVAA
jgi:hemoglobin-like flavoprotein